MDEWLLNLVNGSVLTLGVVNILIKAISRITPWKYDNMLSDAFDEILGMLFPRGGGRENSLKALEVKNRMLNEKLKEINLDDY